SAECFIAGDAAHIHARGAQASIDLAGLRGLVELRHDLNADTASILNLTAALLLARMQRYLMHCGAVVHGGSAWLLAGDAHAGKTTTALNLSRAGWTLLSDDHTVLYSCDGEWHVQGWPRRMHIDTGWEGAGPTGVRRTLEHQEAAISLGTQPAVLRGLLLPRVIESGVTSLTRAPAADAVAMLLRQAAWCLADPAV